MYGWSPLVPSIIEARLRILAFGATASLAVALTIAGLQRDSLPATLAGAAGVLAALLLLPHRWRPARVPLLRLTDTGAIEMAPASDAEWQAARVQFWSPWLIVLASGRLSLTVWSDALPAQQFRRLSALARWQRGRTAAPVAGAARR